MANADSRELLYQMLQRLTSQLSTMLSPTGVRRVLESLFEELDQVFVPPERQTARQQRLADNAQWLGLASASFDPVGFARKHVQLQVRRQAEEAVCIFSPVERQLPWLAQTAKVTGLSHARRLASKGTGAVVVSAHVGPMVYYGPLLAYFLANEGPPPEMVMIANPPSNERVARQFEDFGKQHGSRMRYFVKPMEDLDAFRTLLLKELARGTWVLTQVDVLSGGGSTRTVEMFGRKLRMPGIWGAVSLASRHGVPTLPVSTSRTAEGGVKLRIERPVAYAPKAGSKVAQQVASIVEKWVRANPADWGLLPNVHRLAG